MVYKIYDIENSSRDRKDIHNNIWNLYWANIEIHEEG